MSSGKQKSGGRTSRDPDGENRIRVRGKRLDEIDETKLTLAYWLLAKQLVEDKTDPRQLTEDEVRKVAATLDEPADRKRRSKP